MTLSEVIRDRGIKLRAVADRIGIAPYTLTRKINGDLQFKMSEVAAISDYLRLTAEEREDIFFRQKVDE
ncbi:MAG: helix-turn-helix domain-containing protein [Oscillospiraceae bacterium]|nr:helix-turn-helix domain-containing protein [Lachnospiraceae bacterium]MBO7727972.1 helix-turn-helix domain-containing protein [Oscillospiraceae bacterium]